METRTVISFAHEIEIGPVANWKSFAICCNLDGEGAEPSGWVNCVEAWICCSPALMPKCMLLHEWPLWILPALLTWDEGSWRRLPIIPVRRDFHVSELLAVPAWCNDSVRMQPCPMKRAVLHDRRDVC